VTAHHLLAKPKQTANLRLTVDTFLFMPVFGNASPSSDFTPAAREGPFYGSQGSSAPKECAKGRLHDD
jgi:hypothetical protein